MFLETFPEEFLFEMRIAGTPSASYDDWFEPIFTTTLGFVTVGTKVDQSGLVYNDEMYFRLSADNNDLNRHFLMSYLHSYYLTPDEIIKCKAGEKIVKGALIINPEAEDVH